jgi:hypothetical protein
MTLTIPTSDLVGVLSDVVPFASAADDLPTVNCVRLEWDGGQLHALATDMYRMGISSWEPVDIAVGEEIQDDMFTEWGSGDAPWRMTIALDEAVELVKVFKLPVKEGQTPLTVEYAPFQATFARYRDTGHSAITVVAPDTGVTFPDLRALLGAKDTLEPTTGVHFNAKWLADFAKVRPRTPMHMRFSEGFTRIDIGERFVGGIIPAKVGK